MKKILYTIGLSVLMATFSGCTLDYVNPNAAGEEELNTKDALIGLAVGIQQQYSVEALNFAVFVPSMTTRETSLILTNVENQEFERGGTQLLATNGRVIDLFSTLTKVKGMAETLIANSPEIEAEAGTISGLMAWGNFYRALTLGTLAQSWEQVPKTNSRNNDAEFVSRKEVLIEAIDLLDEAIEMINETPLSNEVKNILGQYIDLENCLQAHLSRYHLMLGNYQAAIDAANAVDLTSSSVFSYDDLNQNPMYLGMVRPGEFRFFASRENFGLPAGLKPEVGDERISFYLTDAAATSLSGLSVFEGSNAPFFSNATASIPVYLPGEILLNKAEAYARMGETTAAVDAIDAVREKSATTDIFGLGANLPAYSGGTSQIELLDEIYKNRRIELHLTGLSLEDSRRFGRGVPAEGVDYTTERSRNFYPYPSTERANNPNTPADPKL